MTRIEIRYVTMAGMLSSSIQRWQQLEFETKVKLTANNYMCSVCSCLITLMAYYGHCNNSINYRCTQPISSHPY